jgi:hypothetical protein
MGQHDLIVKELTQKRYSWILKAILDDESPLPIDIEDHDFWRAFMKSGHSYETGMKLMERVDLAIAKEVIKTTKFIENVRPTNEIVSLKCQQWISEPWAQRNHLMYGALSKNSWGLVRCQIEMGLVDDIIEVFENFPKAFLLLEPRDLSEEDHDLCTNVNYFWKTNITRSDSRCLRLLALFLSVPVESQENQYFGKFLRYEMDLSIVRDNALSRGQLEGFFSFSDYCEWCDELVDSANSKKDHVFHLHEALKKVLSSRIPNLLKRFLWRAGPDAIPDDDMGNALLRINTGRSGWSRDEDILIDLWWTKHRHEEVVILYPEKDLVDNTILDKAWNCARMIKMRTCRQDKVKGVPINHFIVTEEPPKSLIDAYFNMGQEIYVLHKLKSFFVLKDDAIATAFDRILKILDQLPQELILKLCKCIHHFTTVKFLSTDLVSHCIFKYAMIGRIMDEKVK